MRLFMFGYPGETDWYELRVIGWGTFLDSGEAISRQAVVADLIDRADAVAVRDDEEIFYLLTEVLPDDDRDWPEMCRFRKLKTSEVIEVPSESVGVLADGSYYYARSQVTGKWRDLFGTMDEDVE